MVAARGGGVEVDGGAVLVEEGGVFAHEVGVVVGVESFAETLGDVVVGGDAHGELEKEVDVAFEAQETLDLSNGGGGVGQIEFG